MTSNLKNNWFEYLLLLALLLCCLSCATTKDKTRKQTDTETIRDIKEKETIRSTRKGDTLSYTVLNPILKDTVIYVRNKEKIGSNTLRIAYDTSGKQTIDCMSVEINQLKETIRSISENESKKENLRTKEKTSTFNGVTILYIFIGLAGLMIVNKIANKFI